MKLDAYVKTVLTVIAVALLAIAINLWSERVVSPAEAQMASVVTASAEGQSQTFEQMAGRVWVVEQVQKHQAQRIEALRAALESTVLNATRRGYFPDSNWSTVKWEPEVPPAGGN